MFSGIFFELGRGATVRFYRAVHFFIVGTSSAAVGGVFHPQSFPSQTNKKATQRNCGARFRVESVIVHPMRKRHTSRHLERPQAGRHRSVSRI